MSQRIFHELQARVGDEGRYQYLLIAYCCIISIPSYSCFFANAFLFYQEPYVCPSSINNCQEYVCSLSTDLRSQFIHSQYSTLASRMGDYRCQDKGDLLLSQSIIYIGSIAACVVGTLVVGALTHRKIILVTSFICIFGLLITLFSQSMVMAVVGLVINIFAASIQSEVYISYIVETTSEGLRQKGVFMTYFSFTFGVVLTSLLFWLIPLWQIVIVICLLLPNVLTVAASFLFVQQTPLDLVTNYTPDQVVRSLARVAVINGVPCDVKVQQVANIRRQYDQNSLRERNGQNLTAFDLFRYPSLRCLSITVFFIRLLLSFVFYSPQFFLQNFASSIYLNGIIMAVAQTLSSFFAFCLLKYFSRKSTIAISSLLSAGLAFVLLIFVPCAYGHQCTANEKNLQTIGLFLFKFINTVMFAFVYIYKTEVYPSQVRLIGLQVAALAGKLGIALSPGVSAVFSQAQVSIFLAYSVVCVLLTVLVLPLPQTFGIPPPQTIEELNFKVDERRGVHQENQR